MTPAELLATAPAELATLDADLLPLSDFDQWVWHIQTESALPLLIRAARAREHAMSYRDFKVGVAAIALARLSTSIHIVHGVNIKPQAASGPINIHAEQLTLEKAYTIPHIDHIPILALVGDIQHDTHSGQHQHTLQPCGLCRPTLAHSTLINEQTLIISAAPDLSTVEWYGIRALQAFHDTGDSSGITTVTHLPPFPQLGTNPEAFDAQWDSRVAIPLAARALQLHYAA